MQEKITEALNDSSVAPAALWLIDSTVLHAHHQAAGGKGDPDTWFPPFEE